MQRVQRIKNIKFDSTIDFKKYGYEFISKKCSQINDDIFQTRLFFKKVTCVMGEKWAEIFYNNDLFTRKGAMPPSTLMLLQDIGSVQTLDGSAHLHRKKMFMSLMTENSINRLAENFSTIFKDHFRFLSSKKEREFELHEELKIILCKSVCQWSGINLNETLARQKAMEFGSMIEGAGKMGPSNWKAMLRRSRTERWARSLIKEYRKKRRDESSSDDNEKNVLSTIALHKDHEGKLLKEKIAAIELINILRPTVAVARYMVYAALAVLEHPVACKKIQSGDQEYLKWFVLEVRRFYPFFPFVGGLVKKDFSYKNINFKIGQLVILDIYGTNHDGRSWSEPNRFIPDRFKYWDKSPNNLIPQGGGSFENSHRCPGEMITNVLLERFVDLIINEISYEVSSNQNLEINLSKFPTLPKSGFIIKNISVGSKNQNEKNIAVQRRRAV